MITPGKWESVGIGCLVMSILSLVGGAELVAEGIKNSDPMPVSIGGIGLVVSLGYLLAAVESWRGLK